MVRGRNFDGTTSRGNIWRSGLGESSRKAIVSGLVSLSDVNRVIDSVKYNRLGIQKDGIVSD